MGTPLRGVRAKLGRTQPLDPRSIVSLHTPIYRDEAARLRKLGRAQVAEKVPLSIKQNLKLKLEWLTPPFYYAYK